MSLFEAVAAGEVARVEELLAQGTHPDPFDSEGCTPLMKAAEAGREDLVRLLMEGGADPILQDRLGETALLKAATNGHARLCALLQDKASDEEKELARTLLRAAGWKDGIPPRPPEPPRKKDWRDKVVTAGAWISNKVGEGHTAQRVERAERAEKKGRGES
jgi:uncharacterized protein